MKITLEPTSILAGDKLRVTALTLPDAACSITIKFRHDTWQGPTRRANEAGKVVWTPSTERRAPYTATVTVICVLGDQKAWDTAHLIIWG